ncbi:MAG: fumarate hydratase [Clostridium sp.]|nr:fumarate hydratase [Clostridium sp.]
MVREIHADQIKTVVYDLFLKANYEIGDDIARTVEQALINEESPIGCQVLRDIVNNNRIAAEERIAICQDTGMAFIFAQIGQDAHIIGGNYEEAVNEGVRRAYSEGYLRKSVVNDPLFDRKNTLDNTPAIIYTDLVPGSRIRITVSAKGFGSENMSRIKMLTPAQGVEGVLDFILETVQLAGPNACPPVIVGVCIGGSMDKAALLAKKATIRGVGSHNPDPRYAELEHKALKLVNDSGIGPGGLGGRTTALAVNIEYFPTHIASIPVAVNLCCHASRHAEAVI